MQKFLLSLLSLLSFSAIVILSNSSICISDGCNFNNNICENSACINETIIQHLDERTQLFNAFIELRSFAAFVVVLILLFFVKKYLYDEKFHSAKFYAKQKILNLSIAKLFNYIIEAFYNGIIHPKIY